MKRIDKLTDEFKLKYERFWIGCDSLEEIDCWNKNEYGEMDVFYQNELISVILKLVVADGEISDAEVRYLNENFGFDYSVGELADIYENCREEIGDSFAERFAGGIAMMRSVNEKLADAYKELLNLICDIIIESDDVVAPEEIEEAKKLKALF